MLVSLDTLRADRLGCHGYERDTSPRLDAFAARSRQFVDATAAAANTTPSHWSMFTGLHAPVHGMFNVEVQRSGGGGLRAPVLPRSIPTLAEQLSDAGFQTVAFTDGGYLTREFQFDRGFEHFDRSPETVDKKVDRVLEWIETADRSRRTFLFVHTYEVHAPYVPPVEHDVFTDPSYGGPLRARVEELRRNPWRGGVAHAKGFLPSHGADVSEEERRYLSDLYDGCIRFTDAEIGRLLDVLGAPPWSEDTAVLVLSDHGEAFLEHHSFSHRELYQTVVNVPFMLHVPGEPPGVVDRPISGVDVTPTVLDVLGLPLPALCDGVSVLGDLDPDRNILSYRDDPAANGGVSLRRGPMKLLRNVPLLPWERYDLSADPAEREALPLDTPDTERMLRLAEEIADDQRAAAELLREGEEPGAAGELSPETIESLRALGYVK